MLTVLLFTSATDPVPDDVLRRSLDRLAVALTPHDQLIALACGNADAVRAEFSHHGITPLQIDMPNLPRAEALTLARQQADHPYLLCLSGWDMVEADGLAQLRKLLSTQTPEAVVLNRGAWWGAPEIKLPAPDARRMAALETVPNHAALLDLTPDPGRVLLHARLATRIGTDAVIQETPAQDQLLWQQILETASSALLCAAPLWHSPLRPCAAAPTLGALIPKGPETVSPQALRRGLLWADDALSCAAPQEARAILRAAQALRAHLDPDTTIPGDGPASRLLRALQGEGPAMALAGLALDFSMAERDKTEALAAAIGNLRNDLNLALPGPEYLRHLYDRARAR